MPSARCFGHVSAFWVRLQNNENSERGVGYCCRRRGRVWYGGRERRGDVRVLFYSCGDWILRAVRLEMMTPPHAPRVTTAASLKKQTPRKKRQVALVCRTRTAVSIKKRRFKRSIVLEKTRNPMHPRGGALQAAHPHKRCVRTAVRARVAVVGRDAQGFALDRCRSG